MMSFVGLRHGRQQMTNLIYFLHILTIQHADLYMMDQAATQEVLVILCPAVLTVMFNL